MLSTRDMRERIDSLFLGIALEYLISERNAPTNVEHTPPGHVRDVVTR